MSNVFKAVDEEYHRNIIGDLHIAYHNHLVKYKDHDRIHIQAMRLFNRHFNKVDPDEPYHRYSRMGQFIQACITAGYVKAKLEQKHEQR
jgi:hypothetical protein